MNHLVHKIAATLAMVAVMFPVASTDSPTWLKAVVAVVGGLTLLFSALDKVLQGKGAPPPLLLLVLALALSACPKPIPEPGEPTKPNVITCGVNAIQQCAPEALPAVNACLAGMDDIVTCVIGLIKPGTCLVYETLVCVLRHEGSAAALAAKANPDNTLDARRAARAKEFLERTGAQFGD